MSKPVTRDRILEVHAKIDAFCDRLTDADMRIMSALATHGLRTVCNTALGRSIPQIENDKVRLEMNLVEITSPEQVHALQDRLFKNIAKANQKRDKVKAIQLAHNISGLELTEDGIGDGVIERWTESDSSLWLTDDDLNLLRGDRLKLLQFWIDHVLLNNLEIYKDVDGEWVESTLEYIQIMSRDYDWVHFWENLDYLKPDKSKPVTGTGGFQGHLCDRSSTPQDGFKKHHEIHLILGDGKYLDDPERSMWVCAMNGVMPYR